MSGVRLFIDFGSTFTKVVAIDVHREELLARVQAPSTVSTDVTVGLEEAFSLLSEEVPIGQAERERAVACSSAAGGLRVVCVGLVPEYTTEAGRQAALGAGAKIVGSHSFELTEDELREVEEGAPDIVLLTGGTDGGNKKVILHNARMLARSGPGITNIIVAGNKSAYDGLKTIFASSGKNVIYANNVLPGIGELAVDSANQKIRELFIRRITEAKGMGLVRRLIGDIIMPTPAAVLEAARLLADGTNGASGRGDLLLVDVGGATTDVYSMAKGLPTQSTVKFLGLPEPYAKRTVEGDLGLLHNVDTLTEIAKGDRVPVGFEETVRAMCRTDSVPAGDRQVECHLLLSHVAVRAAVDRHVGSLKLMMTPHGEVVVQRGKDLTGVEWVVGAGGPIAFSSDPRRVLEGAVFHEDAPTLLKPKGARMLLDRHYVLFALGLLAQSDPRKALSLMNRYLVRV